MYKAFFRFFLITIAIFLAKPGHTQSIIQEPRVPCIGEVNPPFPYVGHSLVTRIWRQDQIPNWVPPFCLDWKARPFDFLLAIAGSFRTREDIATIARRVVSFSTLTNVRYWSITNQEWRELFSEAGTLSKPNLQSRRNDFTDVDVQAGAQLHYFQDENTLLGPVVFRMKIHDRTFDQLVFSIVNISPFQVAVLDVVKTGRFEQFYFIRKGRGDTWTYYSLVRTQLNHAFLSPSPSSSLNRASAYFRHIAGLAYESKFPFAAD